MAQQMEKLTREMERRNSFWRALGLGIVRGIGMVIGATVLAAAALAILWRIVQGIGLEDLAGKFGLEIPSVPADSISPEILERFGREGIKIPGSR